MKKSISLPVMDGLQAANYLKQLPATRNIPILAVTARSLPGDRTKCLDNGCDDYLAKPFTFRQLEVSIYKLLEPGTEGTCPM